jgi:GNAT superfamily N-acetyltransferase
MEIRPAVLDDAQELAALHLRVWDEAYAGLIDPALLAARAARPVVERVATWRERLHCIPTWVAMQDETIVGFAQAGPGRDADRPGLELMALYVLAAVYGTGVGHALLSAAIGHQAAYLWVLDGNERAVRFYEKHGFAFDGTHRQDKYGAESRMVRG